MPDAIISLCTSSTRCHHCVLLSHARCRSFCSTLPPLPPLPLREKGKNQNNCEEIFTLFLHQKYCTLDGANEPVAIITCLLLPFPYLFSFIRSLTVLLCSMCVSIVSNFIILSSSSSFCFARTLQRMVRYSRCCRRAACTFQHRLTGNDLCTLMS